MLLAIPDVLTEEQVTTARELLERADWVDGKVTAGPQSARAKRNMQLPEGSAAAETLGDMILTALQRNSLFVSAALPLRVFPRCSTGIREGIPSATTWTTPSGRCPPRGTVSGPICQPRCSSPTRKNTKAVSWSWKIPTASTG